MFCVWQIPGFAFLIWWFFRPERPYEEWPILNNSEQGTFFSRVKPFYSLFARFLCLCFFIDFG